MDINDVAGRMEQLRGKIEKAKTEKARAEANLDHAEVEIKRLTEELQREYGLKPDQLDGEIERLDKVILETLERAEGIMNETEGL
ncbi:MAG: hypothetical protein FH749_06950 [Firmicutes bacterium]|nr:hypothetical protein [Bacillota bacterium]